jgi:uncharacterized protein with von Willebrand factor type A (vWA) domain
MRYTYGEFDGEGFVGPDDLFAPNKVVEFILQYGQNALDAMEQFDNPDEQAIVESLIEAGLLERDEASGQLRLTPKMLRGIEHKALRQIFENLKQGSREGHPTAMRGRSDERTDGTKAYTFGDPLSELDLGATMRNAVRRQHDESGRAKLPIKIGSEDFELYNADGQTDVATCVLLDLSGSMMRWGRFYHAKRVALGMQALVRNRFPQDTIDFVGFHSMAEVIPESQLPLIMPKPVTIHDHAVRMRTPIAEAQRNPDIIPHHFTNLHMGLRLARQTLQRRGSANKQLFIITDGQPTAHVEDDMLYLLYPPTERTATATLTEAMRCKQQGIRFATFALIEDYWAMDWVSFVEQLTRLTRGIAYYGTSEDMASTVIESYLSGRKRKSYIA